MKEFNRWLKRGAVMVLTAVGLSASLLPAAAFADSQAQVVRSGWIEVLNIDADYSYHWELRLTVTVEDAVVTDVKTVGRAIGGGSVPPLNIPYWEKTNADGTKGGPHVMMENLLIAAELDATKPDSVDAVDTVSGATHTATWMKRGVKQALVTWNENLATIKPIVNQLDAIGESSDASQTADARKAYDALSDPLKTYVPAASLAKLEVREKALADEAAAAAVVPLIEAAANSGNEADAQKARAAYDALTADQKKLVSNETVKKLTSAEDAIAVKAKAKAEAAAKAKAAAAAEANLANGTVTVAKTTYVFATKPLTPSVIVKSKSGKVLTLNTDYTVAYSANKNVGTAKVTVTGKGAYNGTKTATFAIVKAVQPLTVKAAKSPAVKAGKTLAAKKAYTVKKNQGKVTYKLISVPKKAKGKISVSSAGKITAKKGLKGGTYIIKVKVTAKGNANYKSGSKTVVLKLKVK